MNWMFEPCSKDYYYEDDSGGDGYSSPMRWSDIFLFPIYMILALILFAIIEAVIIPIGIIYSDFDATVKRISKSGKLESPGSVYTSISIAVILSILIWVAGSMFWIIH